MYSYEERMAAVELYIESDFSENTVVQKLGYPSSNTLRSWYKEFKATGTLRAESPKKPKYTQQQKAAAVAYFADHSTTIKQTCRAMGYPSRYVLRQWIMELRPELLPKGTVPCKQQTNRVQYSQELKRAAVEDFVVNRMPVYKVAAKYNVSRASISKWKRQLFGKGDPVLMKKGPEKLAMAESKEELEAEVSELKSQIYHLQMERDALVTATELLKKAEGINLKALKNKEKAVVIDALRKQYRLKDLLKMFQISKSSYCYQANVLAQPDKYQNLRVQIQEIFEHAYHSYGYRRIYAALKKAGTLVSEKVVRRIMKEDGLTVPFSVKRKKYSSYKGEISPEVENIINRDFHADAPNQKWLTDITEFALPAGKVYLSPIIDCYDGLPVTWTIGTRPNAELVNTMLDQAISSLKPEEHPIIHSDRGCHYRWPGWIERMDQAQLKRSMSKKGCSPDNAACEGLFGRLKNEMFYYVSWKDCSIAEFIDAVDKYLHWYAEDRIKLSLGGMSPLEYRRSQKAVSAANQL